MISDLAGRGPRVGLAVLFAVGALGVGLAACGDDEDEGSDGSESAVETDEGTESAESAEAVTVTAVEYEFDLSATPTADTQTVTFDNQGEEFHVMIFARINEGYTLDEAIMLEGEKGSADIVAEAEAKPGESVDVEVKGPLEPGPYAMLCPVGSKEGPHFQLGQLEEFDIE